MANTKERRSRISGIRPGAASAALAFVVVLVLGPVAAQSAQAQTFTVLHSFKGSSDGAAPFAGLVQDTAGNLYGTTHFGGSSSYGTVFKVSATSKETLLHTFTGPPDGAYPFAKVIRDTAGNLYGTTFYGGRSGGGTVFKVTATGKETILYNFTGGSSDGCGPYGGLLLDTAGNLYGTTFLCGASGAGTVFKVSKTGTETLLHSFAGGASDGAHPLYGNLLMDAKGNLYGVTYAGGASDAGVLYMLSSNGTSTVLYSFAGGTTDGCYPYGTPAMDSAGNFYGTANACGSSGLGIVWKVSQGTETVLHNFAGGSSDGADPFAGVVMDTNGNLYGVTLSGGASNYGTVYELDEGGGLTLLHSFAGSDGKYPTGGLSRDAEGDLFGTTLEGTSGGQGCYGNGCGTVWKLTP